MRSHFLRLVALVARRDYIRTVKRRGFIAGTLLLPLGVAALLGISSLAAQGSLEPPSGPIYVVNESSVPIQPIPQLTPEVVMVDRATADASLADGSANAYFLIPATWPGNPSIQQVTVKAAGSSPLQALAAQESGQAQVELLTRVALLQNAGLPNEDLALLLTPPQFATVDTNGQPVDQADIAAGFLLPYAFTLIFMLSIFITSGYLLQSVTEEKENRVIEIILSSIPAVPLMAGKVLGLGAAGLTQVVIWLATAFIALPLANAQFSLNLSIPLTTVALAMVFFALGYISYGAIFAAIGAIAPGAREGQQYGSFVAIFAVIPLILSSVFLTDLSSPIVLILCLLPLTAPAAILEVLALSPSPPWLLIAASLVIQVIFVIVAVIASGRIFRATVLLYGVRPSARRISDAVLARG
jgi:ABC-2 type transport system permease protein